MGCRLREGQVGGCGCCGWLEADLKGCTVYLAGVVAAEQCLLCKAVQVRVARQVLLHAPPHLPCTY